MKCPKCGAKTARKDLVVKKSLIPMLRKAEPYEVCPRCGYREKANEMTGIVRFEKKTEPEIKKMGIYPKRLDGHPVRYIYVLGFTPLVDIKNDVLQGEERIVSVESGNGVINIVYCGKVVGTIKDDNKLKMLSDWERKDLPKNGVMLSDGKSLNLRFYQDRRAGNEYREQSLVGLSGFSRESAQEIITVLADGDELEFEESDDGKSVYVLFEGERIGTLPSAQAKKYLNEGAYGVFFERSEESGEKEKPYVRIFW